MVILERVFLSMLIGTNCWAEVSRPMIAASSVADSELRRHVETHDRRTLSEHIEANRPGSENEARLRSKLESAQRAWLGGSVDRARGEFVSITELARLADWRDPQREVVLYAHMRLAQTSSTPIERTEWLEKAARFAPDLSPDASLFPPPLLREYADVRSTVAARSVSLSLRDVFPGFRFVYVDGRKFELESNPTVKITPGEHRVTAVGDRQAPVTDEMSAARLGVFKVKEQVLVTSCGPASTTLDSGLVVDVLHSPDCPRTSVTSPLVPGPDWAKVPSEVATRPRRAWLWIGAIAVGTAIVVSVARNQRKSEPTSVHREGF